MRRLLFVVALLCVGCTDVKVITPMQDYHHRVDVVEFNEHGCINGRVIRSFIVKDSKTEKEFLVVNYPYPKG